MPTCFCSSYIGLNTYIHASDKAGVALELLEMSKVANMVS